MRSRDRHSEWEFGAELLLMYWKMPEKFSGLLLPDSVICNVVLLVVNLCVSYDCSVRDLTLFFPTLRWEIFQILNVFPVLIGRSLPGCCQAWQVWPQLSNGLHGLGKSISQTDLQLQGSKRLNLRLWILVVYLAFKNPKIKLWSTLACLISYQTKIVCL